MRHQFYLRPRTVNTGTFLKMISECLLAVTTTSIFSPAYPMRYVAGELSASCLPSGENYGRSSKNIIQIALQMNTTKQIYWAEKNAGTCTKILYEHMYKWRKSPLMDIICSILTFIVHAYCLYHCPPYIQILLPLLFYFILYLFLPLLLLML